MFDNIGEKIRGLGKFVCYSGITVSWILCIAIIAMDDEAFLIGIFIAIIGSVLAWLSSLTLVGFGEIIVRLTSIDEGLKNAGVTKHEDKRRCGLPVILDGDDSDGDNTETEEDFIPNYSCLGISVRENSVDTGTCQECYSKEVKRTLCHIKCEMGTKERKICDFCIEGFREHTQY